jgi:hypothetical protein
VYGVDGLKTGGGGGGAGGGGGGTNCCACAWLSAPARRAIQPATKHLEKAQRPNLANGISVFFKSPRAPKENVGTLSPALVRPPLYDVRRGFRGSRRTRELQAPLASVRALTLALVASRQFTSARRRSRAWPRAAG